MAEPTPANAAPAAAPPPAAAAAAGALRRTRGRWWHACAGVAATLMTLVIAMAAALWWAVGSERGSAWVLSALPGVDVTAPKGALLGDFEAQRVSIRLPGDGGRVLLESAGWRGLRIAQVAGPRWCLITLADLHARRVDVTLARSTSNEPPALPADLQLPVEVDLRSVRVGELHLSALGEAPLRDLQARVHLGANAGAEHRIEQLSLAWDRLHGSGTARIASAAPMVLDVAVSLAQEMPADTAAASAAMSATTATALPAWSAQATLAGPLAEPLLQATVRAQPSAQRPAQALDARASVRPFARWPLGEVQVRTTALDLSAFSSAAPATALTGQADAKSTGLDQPAHIAIALNNALAGRWNEGRLPLRSLTLDVDGRPDQPGALALRTLAAELAMARNQPKAALAALNHPSLQNLKELPAEQQVRTGTVHARAYEADGQTLAAARERVAMAPLLTGDAAKSNHEAIWALIAAVASRSITGKGVAKIAPTISHWNRSTTFSACSCR